jgi:ATP-dependent Clp protease adaptor protein ClpS
MSPITSNPYGEPDVILEDELQEPRLYRVLLHNDDYTSMDFVIAILVEVFHKSAEQAAAIMLSVHEKGMGVCGVYPHEVAETKVVMVHNRARRAGFPLKSTMEEAG